MSDVDEDAARLRAAVDDHLDRLAVQAACHPFVDLPLVQELRVRFEHLLDRWGTWDDAQRTAVRGAIAYLVDSDDEEHDLHSPIGLVDDEERLAALERRLGLR